MCNATFRSAFGLVLGLVMLCPAPAAAADGVRLIQQITGEGTSVRSEVLVEAQRIRTEVSDPAGRRQVIIFDAARDVLLIVDEASRRYTELGRADAERMGVAMQGAMAMMQEQLAKMPPEQRKMMEEKMGGMLAALSGPADTPVYKRVGTATVGRWTCDRYEGYVGGNRAGEVCTVAPEVLGLKLEDFQVLTKMAGFVRALLPQMADRFVGFGSADAGFDGLPVRAVSTANGTTTTMELTEVRRDTFDDALFVVPADYTRTTLPQF